MVKSNFVKKKKSGGGATPLPPPPDSPGSDAYVQYHIIMVIVF